MTVDRAAELARLIRTARRITVDLTHRAADDQREFGEIYALGYHAGIEAGRQQVLHEIRQADQRHTEHLHAVSGLPLHTEIEARRWDGRRGDFGKPRPGDHEGGPVDWDTGRPLTDGKQGAA